ncbi:hypothetical protein HY285_05150 [Candidatus Peregrinibacteria bacterium]|nr:hypothetical protein [Candidatus Peregrinibacteria bacterium]
MNKTPGSVDFQFDIHSGHSEEPFSKTTNDEVAVEEVRDRAKAALASTDIDDRSDDLPFEEPESHQKAREILGRDFISVEAAQRHIRPYTADELEARKVIPYSEEVLRECAGEFALLPTHPLDLPGFQACHPERFVEDPNNPWVGQKQQRKLWSSRVTTVPWLLIRKNPVPDSCSQSQANQEGHLRTKFSKERFVLPCEYADAGLKMFLETRQKLCEGFRIRFAVQTAEGYWVSVGWNGDRLSFYSWRADARENIGSPSARDS